MKIKKLLGIMLAMSLAATTLACGEKKQENKPAKIEKESDKKVTGPEEPEEAETELNITDEELDFMSSIGSAVAYCYFEGAGQEYQEELFDVSNGKISDNAITHFLYYPIANSIMTYDEEQEAYVSPIDGIRADEEGLIYAKLECAENLAEVIFSKNESFKGASYDVKTAYELSASNPYDPNTDECMIGSMGDPGAYAEETSHVDNKDGTITFNYDMHYASDDEMGGTWTITYCLLDQPNSVSRFGVKSVEGVVE